MRTGKEKLHGRKGKKKRSCVRGANAADIKARHLHLLPGDVAGRRRHVAGDARVPPSLRIRLLLVLADGGAVVVCDDCGFLLRFFRLGLLGHADEPVEREGGDDVEDAVGPEDTCGRVSC
jgi:hypothetical protein